MKYLTIEKDTVYICGRSVLSGRVTCPASKSAAHRELIASALADKDSVLICNGISKDIEATIGCLNSLGASITADGNLICVSPIKESPSEAVLDCNESGTTLRFMIPLAAFLGVSATFVCAPSLTRRPISELCDELSAHGVSFPGGYSFPLRMCGKASGGEWSIRGDISSQFISGLLLAFPLAGEDSVLSVTGRCESLPYIELTCSVMRSRRIGVSSCGAVYSVSCGIYSAVGCEDSPFSIEGDWSGAGFWFAAGLSSDEGITVCGLSLDSVQGDRAIYDVLASSGADISVCGNDITIRKSKIHAFDCDCSQTPDMVPILSVCAAVADGESRIRGIERLRLKESDRINSSMDMLDSLGIRSHYSEGILTVHGGKIGGGKVDGYNDHRIVMSAAVASCFTNEKIQITDAHATGKSYPDFFSHFDMLSSFSSFTEV